MPSLAPHGHVPDWTCAHFEKWPLVNDQILQQHNVAGRKSLIKMFIFIFFFGAKQRKIIKQFPGILVDWNEQAYKGFHLIWASRLRSRGHRQRLSRGQNISELQVWRRISKCKCGPFLPLLLTKLICFCPTSMSQSSKKNSPHQ